MTPDEIKETLFRTLDKLEGISIVKYFTSFFEAVCSGRTDYENLLPATISLPA